MADNPDTFSPAVSYQFQETLTESGSQTPVFSPAVSYQFQEFLFEAGSQIPVSTPVVSYQYLEWPGDANLLFTDSPNVSYNYTYPSQVNIAPVGGRTTFGNVQVGANRTLQFTIKNESNVTISGAATVGAPFVITQGATYILNPGQSQTVIVQFSPTTSGAISAYITFSNGSSWLLTASAGTDPTSTAGGISGQVTDSNGVPLNNVAIQAESAASNMSNGGGGFPTHTAANGNYSLSKLLPGNYQILAYPPGPPYSYAQGNVTATVTAGNTTTCNITLAPVPPANQPPKLSVNDTPVILVRGVGANHVWVPGSGDTWGDQTVPYDPANPTLSQYLKHEGFTQIWDCNQPDNDAPSGQYPIFSGSGQVINGEKGVVDNSYYLDYYIHQKALQYKRDKGYYPPSINIITHSMGGLIVRQELSGISFFGFPDPSTGLPVRIEVNKVVMLAPPNAGSEAADYWLPLGFSALSIYDQTIQIGTLSVPIFQPSWDSTKDCTTQKVRYGMNKSWPSSALLYTYAGSGGPTSSDEGLKYCSSKIIKRYQGFSGDTSFPSNASTNDGAVSQASASGLYYPWYYPLVSWLNPAPSSCFDASAVQNEIDTDPFLGGSSHVVDHYTVLHDLPTLEWVVSCLTGDSLPANMSDTPMKAKTSDVGTIGGNQSITNAAPIQMLERVTTLISSGSTNQLAFVSDAASTLTVQYLCTGSDAPLQLTDPSGALITSSTPQSNPNVQYTTITGTNGTTLITFQIQNPALGIWNATVNGTGMTENQLGYDLSVAGDSSITLVALTAPLYHQGQDAVVSCAIADVSTTPPTPIQNTLVTAIVTLPDGTSSQMSLFDDGLHNEGAANDGNYANVFPAVSEAGDYTVNYRVTGTNSQGQPFQRVGSSVFSVSTEDAGLLGDPVYELIDTNGDGVPDYAQLKVWVNPSVAGTYILSGQLVDSTGTNTHSDSEQFYSDGTGPMMVNLIFDLNQIRASSGPGFYQMSNLQLFEVANNESAWLDTYEGSSGFNVTAPPPVITTLQGTQAVAGGQAVTFSINAAGTGSLSYQWYENGAAIAGATGSSYTIADATNGDAGNYTVTVSDPYGDSTTSGTYTLTVNTSIPAIPIWAFATLGLLLFSVAVPFLRARQPNS